MPAALVSSVLANIHRPEDHEPYTIADFLPGTPARKSEDEDMREFIDEIQSGKKFEPPSPEQLAAFKRSMETNFSNVKPCSTSTAAK
jgi:hypothetical protein